MEQILHEPELPIDQQLQEFVIEELPVTPEHIDWLSEKLEQEWRSNMPVPFGFFSEEGEMHLEWFIGHAEHSMEIDFMNRKGLWEWWNSKTDQVHEESLDLESAEDRDKIRKSSTGRWPAEKEGVEHG